MPNSFFGWMPQLYRISEQQILASAGLDAFVFLNFFKMAIRLFSVMAFFALVVLLPINKRYRNFTPYFGGGNGTNDTGNSTSYMSMPVQLPLDEDIYSYKGKKHGHQGDMSSERTYLWAYVVFTYLFVAMTIYSINWETFRIIRFRQDYLGSQSTITDRTFRLTGIPSDLRSEERIKHLIEKLEIGTVETVTLCRDWQEIDDMMEERDRILRKLEGAWTKYLTSQRKLNNVEAARVPRSQASNSQPHIDEEANENGRLLEDNTDNSHVSEGERPQVTIRFGFLQTRSKRVDAIDYYEEKLRRIDGKVLCARKKAYKATDMALVTMDSVASCQMVIQARIDPRPGSLLTKPTPAPSDLVWRNTYALRGVRRMKSWAITIFITFLTLIWIFPIVFLASLVSICTLETLAPRFWLWLQGHSIIYSLFQNGLPTLVVSLLNVAVPYLYDWLSNCQGMISQGDVELSVISKNFFFTFFNTFFVFAVSKSGLDFWSTIQDLLKDTSAIPGVIARDVEDLSIFYTAFIMLQGIGLMPLRMCEVSSVVLHPIYRLMSATPRDYAELRQPPTFQYGFYLPTALLVFNLCLIYSVLRWGFAILLVGTVYFILGYYAFKYMLLYAMDQPQHATGGAWRIICYRVVVGLLVFEVVMIGQIASLSAFVQSIFIFPLIPFTIWYSYYFNQRFDPLTKYIALRAIRSNEDSEDAAAMDETFEDEQGPRPSQGLLRRGSTLDEHREKGLMFVNPSLVAP